MDLSGTFSLTAPTDREVVMSRTFHAPRELVFKAWTDPRFPPHWMLGPEGWTMPVCEIDLRVGGGWHFVWRKDDGTTMEMRGIYREIAPPERLVSTESWGDPWPETINTLVLTERDGLTTATTTILYLTREARDAAMHTGMKDGAAMSYNRLELYLATL